MTAILELREKRAKAWDAAKTFLDDLKPVAKGLLKNTCPAMVCIKALGRLVILHPFSDSSPCI